MNARHLSPNVHPPRHSGFTLTGRAAVLALVDAIDSVCREGGVDPVHAAVHVIQGLNLCKPFHWSAYARIAGSPEPDAATQEAVKAVYMERIRCPARTS